MHPSTTAPIPACESSLPIEAAEFDADSLVSEAGWAVLGVEPVEAARVRAPVPEEVGREERAVEDYAVNGSRRSGPDRVTDHHSDHSPSFPRPICQQQPSW
jgi:hypothetical protein